MGIRYIGVTVEGQWAVGDDVAYDLGNIIIYKSVTESDSVPKNRILRGKTFVKVDGSIQKVCRISAEGKVSGPEL